MRRAVLMIGIGTSSLPNPVPPALRMGSWSPFAFVPPVIPGPELTIDGSGVVVVNCAFTNFHLLLTANVTAFQFINVPAAGITVHVDIEQTGTFSVVFGPKCTPISGVVYAPSQTAGAVDALTFTTTDVGETWRYSVSQPISTGGPGTEFAVTIAPSPASATVANDGVTPSAPSVQVTATPVHGTGTVTHKWTRSDTGGTNFLIDDDTLDNPTLSIAADVFAYDATQQWRDTVTDSATTPLHAQALIAVTLKRTTPVAATWDGVHGSALSIRPSGISTAKIWLVFNPDCSWKLWKQTGIGAPFVQQSGAWGGGLTAADYEVQFTPTHTSGTGPAAVNGAATFQPLSASRTITVSNSTTVPFSDVHDDWSIVAEVRQIANHAVNATGTVTASLTSDIDPS